MEQLSRSCMETPLQVQFCSAKRGGKVKPLLLPNFPYPLLSDTHVVVSTACFSWISSTNSVFVGYYAVSENLLLIKYSIDNIEIIQYKNFHVKNTYSIKA